MQKLLFAFFLCGYFKTPQMKKYTPFKFFYHQFLYILFCASVGFASTPQWTVLNSGTTEKLHDVNFLNPDYGLVVGDNGTVLLTTDGGSSWFNINVHSFSGNVHSGLILHRDTIVVSTFDNNTFTGETYITFNGGANWTTIGNDPGSSHSTQLTTPDHSILYSVGSSLLKSSNLGTSWDTIFAYTGGINSLSQIQFVNSMAGMAGGLNSGFSTYSANMARTEDGSTWYSGDVFSFPNADAYTTLDFPDPDTGFMFTNHYNGFVPSNQNALWKLSGFNLVVNFPGDTSYHFTSQIVNSSTPGYGFAADFLNTQTGYGLFSGGQIFKTNDGGVNWVNSYSSTADTLSDIQMFEDNAGYAAGDDGTILKYSESTAIPSIQASDLIILFPNPASEAIAVHCASSNNKSTYRILASDGKLCQSGHLQNINSIIDLEKLSSGMYSLEISNENGTCLERKRFIKQ